MTRARKIITIMVTFGAIIVIGYFVSALEIIPKNKLEFELRKSILNKRGAILVIQDVTPFKWDRLDIYTPYSTYKDEKGKSIDIDEGHCLLVFSEKGATVSHIKFKRYYGDFSGLHREEGFTPLTGRFKVPNKNQGSWLKLEIAQDSK